MTPETPPPPDPVEDGASSRPEASVAIPSSCRGVDEEEDATVAKSPCGEETCPVEETIVKLEKGHEDEEEDAQPKVLPRLGRQRGNAAATSPRPSKADLIKQQLTALKRPQARNTIAERKGTPQKPPPVIRTQATPTSLSPSKNPLPLKYSQLLETFKSLQMVYRIRKTKSTFLTFADAKISIQKSTKKTFSIKHLAKIKYMIPEILQWQYMEGNADSVASSRLIISLEAQLGINQAPMDDAAIYAELRARLSRHARRAAAIGKENDDLPEADLPDPSLSVLCSSSKALSGRSWSNASAGYRSKSPSSVKSRRPPSTLLTPSKRLELSPTHTPRRLTTVTERSGEAMGENMSSLFKTPEARTSASIFSPCSNNRDVIRECFKRRMLMSPTKVKERERSQALSNMVTVLNDVRAVFHRFKTTSRPLKDVLHAMRTNTKSKYTDEAAQLHLHLLLEYAPQFVKLTGDIGKEIVSIDKECNIPAIKEMLKEIVESRPKIDVTEEALDRRLSQLETLDL